MHWISCKYSSRFTIGKNYAYCVNSKGKYDIVEFIIGHRKDFKYLYNIAVVKLAPQITTKVVCGSLFAQYSHI